MFLMVIYPMDTFVGIGAAVVKVDEEPSSSTELSFEGERSRLSLKGRF